ncbi:MAG: CoA transferase [bacterium]|nr:CoA transferase [bacterium]
MPGALAGVRVLDCADLSGAFAGRLLAAMGADVVLIEPPGGSPLRALPPFWDGLPPADASVFHWCYAAGKGSVVCDPATRPGRARLARLAAAADVVVETGPPGGTLARLGTAHPQLVVASITPFGQTGPWRDWRATDTVAQALGGMLAVNGDPGGPPLRMAGLQAYHQAGIQAAIGIVAALLARDAGGTGQHVDVSLHAAVAAALEHVPGLFHQDGRVAQRQGTLHWTRHFRVGRCRDGWALHCTLGDWTTLREWMRADGIDDPGLDDPALEAPAVRQEQAERLFGALDRFAARYTVAELHEGARLRRLPFAAVRAPEALLHDPQLAARGFFVPLDHPGLGRRLPFPGAPFRLGDLPWRTAPPPVPGADDARVARAWGTR